MDYEIDLSPARSCVRLTVTAETVTPELAEDIYRHLVAATSTGGPYAAIFDLSATQCTTIPTDAVRSRGRRHRLSRWGSARIAASCESRWSWEQGHISMVWPACLRYARIRQAASIRSPAHWGKPTGWFTCIPKTSLSALSGRVSGCRASRLLRHRANRN